MALHRDPRYPIVTIFGVDLGTLIGGAIITETTFGLQGLGQLSIRAVTNSDLPMLMATVLTAAIGIAIKSREVRGGDIEA